MQDNGVTVKCMCVVCVVCVAFVACVVCVACMVCVVCSGCCDDGSGLSDDDVLMICSS